MCLRRKLECLWHGYRWTSRIIRLGKLLDKRLRRSGYQRELHVFPVFSDGVVHHRPTSQQRLGFGITGEDDAVSAFPDGNLTDVADEELAISAAFGGDDHAADVALTRGGDQSHVFS